MNAETVHPSPARDGAYVRLPVPVGDPETFRYGATAEILHVLVDNPEQSFTNRELRRITERGMSGVNAAVESLEALGVITVDRTGRANGVQIDPEMVVKPSDPVLEIPQQEYHKPLRAILNELEDRLDDEHEFGVVCFGSVARGTADRASDIDLFVVVDEDRMHAQREAHQIEQAIASERFDGDRFEPHIIVETQDSAPNHDEITSILSECRTLRAAPPLDALKQKVFESGS